MKLVGLMVARNEEWVIGASMRAALEWCDELVILNHASVDTTTELIEEFSASLDNRIHQIHRTEDLRGWDEMDHRQGTLEVGRLRGGTHFAIIDADEILTANLLPHIREHAEALGPAQALELPMIPCWRSLVKYRADSSVWSRAHLSLVFNDAPHLEWKPKADGYHHHSRLPRGTGIRIEWNPPMGGGVFHLQWASWHRVVAKQTWYRMMELVRWPDRMSPAKLNEKYDQALDEANMSLAPVPESWWGYDLLRRGEGGEGGSMWINLDDRPWHEREIDRLIEEKGRAYFDGLNLHGLA